jgi:hypothetical protein
MTKGRVGAYIRGWLLGMTIGEKSFHTGNINDR